jgi:pimeloyl-ACP methyl ester carboxylesterase
MTTSSTTGNTIEVNGASIYYEERGTGTPVILIHGGFCAIGMWDAILPHLADGYRYILPDSRGHGRSTNPSGELSYMQIADDVAAFITALGLDRPVVCGYSDGGQIAIELGARHPEASSALIIGAAYPDFRSTGLIDPLRGMLAVDESGVPDIAQMETNMGEAVGFLKAFHPGGEQQWQTLVRGTASMWLDYPGLTADQLGRIDTPTLVLSGDRDDFIPLDLSVALYRALPNAELAICPRSDHFQAISPERAAVFAFTINDFVARHAPTS